MSENCLRKWEHNRHRLLDSLAGVLFILGILLAGCHPQDPIWLEPLTAPTQSEYSSTGELYSIYFTALSAANYRGGPDRKLADALDQAQTQIDGALYDLNLWSVRNALIRAHQRGVQVRLVVEGDSLDRPEIQELITAGIPLVADQAESLMHNKFMIIDSSEVWTGSMNLTVNGAYRHLNNLVRIRSTRLAENYEVEFNEMFQEGYFGQDTVANTPYPVLNVDGIRIETSFSPDDGTEQKILRLIREAKESIDFLYYSFTSDQVADALIDQASRGIQVRGVVDAYQERTGLGGEYQRLRDAGLEVYLDAHPEKMHHKVMIIDGQVVVTGSYNLTHSAEYQNDENTLIVYDRDFGEVFQQEFKWIFEEAADR